MRTHTHTSQNNQWDSSDYQYSTVSVSISTQKSIKKNKQEKQNLQKEIYKVYRQKKMPNYYSKHQKHKKKRKKQDIYKKKNYKMIKTT